MNTVEESKKDISKLCEVLDKKLTKKWKQIKMNINLLDQIMTTEEKLIKYKMNK